MPRHEGSRALRVEVLSANALVGTAIAELLRRAPSLDAWHLDLRGDGEALVADRRPDLVLLEPERGRAGLADELTGVRERLGDVPVVLLLQEPEPAHRLLVRAEGVVGCCYRDVGAADLLAGLASMATAGEAQPVPSRARRGPSANGAGDGTGPAVDERLTSREADVLDLYVSGRSRKEIAMALGISEHTVRSHFQAIQTKLSVSSRLEAAALVRRAREGRSLSSPPSELGGPASPPPAPDSAPSSTVLIGLRRSLDREAVGQALAAVPGVQVVGGSGDARSAVADAVALRPSVALLDADLEDGGGVAACTAIRNAGLPTRTIVVSARPDLSVLEAAVEAGADGYLAASDCTVDDLVATVSSVEAGGLAVPAAMLRELLLAQWRERRAERQAVRRFASLTRTERKLLTLLTEGLDHQAIAAGLVVSPHTARTHIQNVLRKLGVHSRVEAANLAVRYDFAGFCCETDPTP